MLTETVVVFGGFSYDAAVFGGHDLTSADVSTLTFEQYISHNFLPSEVGDTYPTILNKLTDASGQHYLYIFLQNDYGFGVVRWKVGVQTGIVRDGSNPGLVFPKGTQDKALDTYVTDFDHMTVLVSNADSIEGAAVYIHQLDITNVQIRSRQVVIYGDSGLLFVQTGTLTGPDTGFFGGGATELGYQKSVHSTC